MKGIFYLAGRFRAWLEAWSIPRQQVRLLATDGAGMYYGVLSVSQP
jgi:hypothetical protein